MNNDMTQYPSGERCPDCNEELMLFDNPLLHTTGNRITCPCVVDRREKERQAKIVHGLQKARDMMRDEAGLGMRYKQYTFAKFKRNAENSEAQDTAQRFVAAYLADESTPGMIFCGCAGNGKTFLACCIANAIIDNKRVSERACEMLCDGVRPMHEIYSPVRFFGTADLLQRIRASFNGYNADEQGAALIDRCKHAPLLVLDDFGAEKPSEWVAEQLYSIIEHRYQHCLHTIITTNCTPGEIQARCGERIADRLRSMCATVPMTGESMRRTAVLPAEVTA